MEYQVNYLVMLIMETDLYKSIPSGFSNLSCSEFDILRPLV